MKPENIMFETDSKTSPVKVIDFGTARIFDKKREKFMKK